MIIRVLFVFAVTACAGPSTSEQRSTLDTIPAAAAAALRAEAHGAEITHVSRETERGQELYEGAWSEGGLGREAKVTADGKVVEVEREVSPADVPAVIRVAASGALPKGSPVTYVLLGNGHYEAETVVNGKEHEAVFAPDGTRGHDPSDGDDEEDDEDDDSDEAGAKHR